MFVSGARRLAAAATGADEAEDGVVERQRRELRSTSPPRAGLNGTSRDETPSMAAHARQLTALNQPPDGRTGHAERAPRLLNGDHVHSHDCIVSPSSHRLNSCDGGTHRRRDAWPCAGCDPRGCREGVGGTQATRDGGEHRGVSEAAGEVVVGRQSSVQRQATDDWRLMTALRSVPSRPRNAETSFGTAAIAFLQRYEERTSARQKDTSNCHALNGVACGSNVIRSTGGPVALSRLIHEA